MFKPENICKYTKNLFNTAFFNIFSILFTVNMKTRKYYPT